jgi:hypothetical protein
MVKVWRFQAEIEVEAENAREAQKVALKMFRELGEEIEKRNVIFLITDWTHAKEYSDDDGHEVTRETK